MAGCLGLIPLASSCETVKTDLEYLKRTMFFMEGKLEDPLEDLDLRRNIGHLALDIHSQYYAVPESYYKRLNYIVETAKEKIGDEKDPLEVLLSIHSTLREDFNYEHTKDGIRGIYGFLCGYNKREDNGDVPLEEVAHESLEKFKKRKKLMDCDTAGFAFLSVGEKLNLPI